MGSRKISHDEAGGARDFALTPQTLFSLDYFTPPVEISNYATTLYHFRCEEAAIRDIQPAAIGHLTIFPHGTGEMRFLDGRVDRSHETNLLTPFSVAAPFKVDGPFHAIGAVLSPLGWAALTGLHAGDHSNRLYAAKDWLGEEAAKLGAELCEDYRAGTLEAEQCALRLCEFIGSRLKPVNPRHASLITETNRWLSGSLSPDVESLYAKLAYSQRQAQRLVERYFGLAPQALARKYRALRAAALYSLPELAPDYEAAVAEAFYDQSHLIREIRLFAGRTPSKLSGEESPYLAELLDLKNLREIQMPHPDAAISDD